MPQPHAHRRRFPSFRALLLTVSIALGGWWLIPLVVAFVADLDPSTLDHPYAVIFGFVVFDALIPVFPSESLLTTGSNLAAQTGSHIELWKLIIAGSLGALIGDSLLYWSSRTVLRGFMAARVERAKPHGKMLTSMEVLSRTAPTLIVFGRFVPGLRFIVSASMGLTAHRYTNFLLWSAVGGTIWASYTCIFSYLVATLIEDRPIISIATSAVVTTALLGFLYAPLKRSWDESETQRSVGAGDAS